MHQDARTAPCEESAAGPRPAASADDVEEVLERRVRRFINAHAGDVHVEEVSEEGDVRLRFSGACGNCPALSATFAVSVLPVLRSVDGVRRVSADGVHMSDAALERVAKIFGPSTTR
jgi:Fe-S cluster biogenesis protein NfuA